MDDAPRGPRPAGTLAALLVAAVLAVAGFAALGVWQVQRLAWKQDLIARVERHVNAAPVAAPGRADWPALTREADEYRRVAVRVEYDFSRTVHVRATTALGAGFWVLTPLRTDGGFWVMVNRGFVPPEAREHWTQPGGDQTVTGLLRFSEPGGTFLQSNDAPQDRWYSRDVQAMAGARRIAGPVAPYFIDAVADPAAPTGWPRGGLTVIRFSNNHLVYAVTWFALAAMVAGAIGYLLIDERRLRRLAGDRQLAPYRDSRD